MKRLPFLDWMRGLALVIMIQCHVFNSFTRMDARQAGLYAISQFVGGMAGPLFLFMAGMTFAFLMDRLERQALPAVRRWTACVRRAAFILAVAFLIRISDWISSGGHGGWETILRVDILNSMGLALLVYSAAACLPEGRRARVVFGAALAVAVVSPLIAGLNWNAAPRILHEYLAPGAGAGHFPFFPCASYVGLGMTAGAALRMWDSSRLDRLLQWLAMLGGTLILAGQYISNLPYAIYSQSNFWTDNPLLILMRSGVMLVMLAASYVWTQYAARPGWSWMQSLGRSSLAVYWVHLMLVYGAVSAPWQRALSIPQALLATLVLTSLMVGLSGLWPRLKARVRRRSSVPSAPHPGSRAPSATMRG